MTTATLPASSTSAVPVAPPIIPGGLYPASRNSDGTWNFYGIPIMGVLKKGDKGLPVELGREWQERAVKTAQYRFREGFFLHPLHFRHTSDPRGKVSAGFFLPTRVGDHQYDGQPMPTIFADYIAVPEPQAFEMLSGRWPYRSIENFDYERAEINELALMDDDEPWFHLPMQTYRVVEGTEAAALNVYDKRQFHLAATSGAGFALKRDGKQATFCAFAPTDEKKKPEDPAAKASAAADPAAKKTEAQQDPEDEEVPEPQAMEMPAWASDLCDMVKEIYARTCAPEAAKAPNPAPAEQPAKSKASAMQKETTVSDQKTPAQEGKPEDPKATLIELAKKQGEADALAEKNSALEDEKTREGWVVEAEKKLAGRIRNREKVRESLVKLAKSSKEELDAYVGVLEASLAPAMPKTADGITRQVAAAAADGAKKSDAPPAPPAADLQAKYGHLGPAEMSRVLVLAAEYDAQKKHLTMSREAYIELALSTKKKEA